MFVIVNKLRYIIIVVKFNIIRLLDHIKMICIVKYLLFIIITLRPALDIHLTSDSLMFIYIFIILFSRI